MRNCYNCEWGRFAKADNMVACGYFFSNHKMCYQKTMEELNLDSLCTGWGYMHRRANDKEGKGFGKGIMTNGVIVFPSDFCCSHYEKLNM